MGIVLAISALIVVAILGAAFILPCEACRRRRERIQNAYEQWRSDKRSTH